MKLARAMLVGIALACFAPSVAAQNADPAARARALDLSKKSRDAYRERRFEEAVSMLLEARSLTREPVLLYNLGRAYEGLGDLERALSAYEDYLREAPKAPDRETTERRVEALKREIAERKAAPPAPPPVVITPPPPPQSVPQRKPSVVPIVVAGTGVATLAAGAGVGLLASGAHSDAEDERSAERATSRQDDADTLALVANVCFVAGGVLTAAGLAWTIVDRTSPRTNSAALRVSPLGIGGTF